jgi:hypothetical protein
LLISEASASARASSVYCGIRSRVGAAGKVDVDVVIDTDEDVEAVGAGDGVDEVLM